jgi:hypothetical protein
MADSLIRFTRGLGMARSGDLAGAKNEIEAIQGIQKALLKAKDAYWAARSQEQVQAVSAWVALAEGSREQAVKLMRSAVDGEDSSVKHVSMENRLYPMRELFAELLLEIGQALRRSVNSKRHSKRIRTATAGYTERREPPKQPEIARKPRLTTPSLWRSAPKPTPIGPRSLRRRRF